MRRFMRVSEPEVQVWPAYADVTFVIVLILLIYLFSHVLISSQTSASLLLVQQRQGSLRDSVLDAVPEGMRQDVQITSDGNLLKITFADRVLFQTAQASLRPQGQEILGYIGDALTRNADSFTRIQVEGHTDDIPIRTGLFASNWELSSARATSVVRFLQDRAGLDPALLSATGYSEYHPVDARPSEEGRARNRRIEMVIVYSLLGS